MPTCFKGPTNFPQRPRRVPGTDKVAWLTWDMLQWFVTTVFDPFAKCIEAKILGGLQYHEGTYGPDNEGDYFFGAVNDASGSPNGYGWQFDTGDSNAATAFTGDGGFVVDTAGDVVVTGTTITFTGNNPITMKASSVPVGGGFYVTDEVGNQYLSLNTHDLFSALQQGGSGFQVSGALGTNVLQAYMEAGGKFQVLDSSNVPILECRDDGTVHIRTGGAVIADL